MVSKSSIRLGLLLGSSLLLLAALLWRTALRLHYQSDKPLNEELQTGIVLSPQQAEHPSREASEPGSPPRSQNPLPSPPGSTVREELSAYWGAKWPDIEREMTKAGLQLDVPYEGLTWEEASLGFEALLPLNEEEVAAQVRDTIQWPEEVSSDWLRSEYGYSGALSEGKKARIDELARPYREPLVSLGEEIARQIDFVSRLKWQNGDFLKAPYSTIGQAPQVGFHSAAYAGNGWAIAITLTEEDYPDIAGLISKAARMRDARDDAVRRALREEW